MNASLICLIPVLMAAAGARAEEKPVALREGPGRPAVEGNCGSCHSLDYLRTNSPFLDRKGWQTEVNKMINVFGAPIAPEDAKTIVDYLAKNYGVGGG
jgi:sulfite dehydrogenase (cytochrome) subunit B